MVLGCNPSSIRSYLPLQLKRSDLFDETALTGLFQGEIKQVSINHLQEQVQVTCFISRRKGVEAPGCQILPFSNRVAKRRKDRQDSFSGACQEIKGLEKLEIHCPLFLQVPGLQNYWKYQHGEKQDMKTEQKLLSLEPEKTLNGSIAVNCQLGIGNFLMTSTPLQEKIWLIWKQSRTQTQLSQHYFKSE